MWTQDAGFDPERLSSVAAVIAPADAAVPDAQEGERPAVLGVTEPRRAFALALREIDHEPSPVGIETTAIVAEDSVIGEGVYVGHHSIIGDGVSVGARTVILDNVSIRAGATIGADCLVNSGVVIGADGFGYERDEERGWIKLKHIGSVVIEDEVEIGANTCIDRGTLGATIIKRQAKVDNLCHIAHNVVVGERAMVIAQSMIGGSVRINPDAWIAPGATVRNGVVIGGGSTVGLGAVVVKDVPDDDVVAGVPARSMSARAAKG